MCGAARPHRGEAFSVAVFIFLFWVVLNGRFTAEIAVFGLVISAALYLFAWKALDYRPRYDLVLVRSLPLLAAYIAVLCWQILLACLAMAGYILSRRKRAEPVLVSFRPPLRTTLARTLLANSITMTPGTITVSLRDGDFQVHCFDRSMARGLDSSPFVRLLTRWEAGL